MSVPPPPAPEGFAWWSPIAAFFLALGVAGLVFSFAGLFGADTDDPGVTVAATYVQNAALVAAMLLLARAGGARLSPGAFGLRRLPVWRAAGLAFAVFVGFEVFLVAWSQLDPGAEDDLATDLGAEDSTLALVAVAILVCFVAPIVEELFFRGFLFGALRRVMPWAVAAIVAGSLFGVIHLGTPAIFLVPLCVLGALLCVLYQRTGSILPGIAVHAVNNGLALAVTLEWTLWQGVLAVVAAPVVAVALASSLAE